MPTYVTSPGGQRVLGQKNVMNVGAPKTMRRGVIVVAVCLALMGGLLASIAAPARARGGGAGREPAYAATLRPVLEAKLHELQAPGAIVLVDVPGQGRWLAGLGTDDLATGAPMNVKDHTRVGSITKTFTATIILQLVDRGRVRLEDPISKYVRHVPNGKNITIRELLGMTAGLFNTTESDELNALLDANPFRVWLPRDLLPFSFSQPAYFAPGTDFHYANTNYILLGLVAERVTGQSLPDLFRRRIFRPVGMSESLLPERASTAIPEPFTHGYNFGTNVQANDAYKAALAGRPQDAQIKVPPGTVPTDVTDWNTSYTYPDGSAISTARDLEKWAVALATGTLLTPETQRERLQFSAVSDFGYGLGIDRSFGVLIGHNGAIPGFQSYMGYDPDKGATIIVLANLQAAPNVYLGASLPADQLAGIIQRTLLPA